MKLQPPWDIGIAAPWSWDSIEKQIGDACCERDDLIGGKPEARLQ